MRDTESMEVVSENILSTLKTRTAIEPPFMYETKPQLGCVPPVLKMDFSRILNKPFFIGYASWATSTTVGSKIAVINIPNDLFINKLAKIPFEASTLYRAKLRLLIQVAGTPMHMGTLLCSAVPIGMGTGLGSAGSSINNLLAAPHVFISANESTSVSLEVPFYVNSKLMKCDVDRTTVSPQFSEVNYSQVVLYVLNALFAPTSGSTTLTVSLHAEFLDLEFYGPHTDVTYVTPTLVAQGFIQEAKSILTRTIDTTFGVARNTTGDFLDLFRQTIRQYTGLHAPGVPQLVHKSHVVARQNINSVDKPVQYEKLDPYYDFDRICKDAIFDTKRDEMLIREIITKPQLLGTFVVKTTDTPGTLCWARPMSPFQQSLTGFYVDPFSGSSVTTSGWSNLFQTLYYLSKYWRGSIKLHFQSVMTNFHFCKLLVAKDYSIRKQGLTDYPSFASVANLLTDTLEFSAGGQVHTIDIPFMSPLEQLPCTLEWNNMMSQMGMYYVYLLQPLVANGTVPTEVRFNVYISAGEDFEFYGYSTNPARISYPFVLAVPPTSRDPQDEPNFPEFQAQGEISDAKVSIQTSEQQEVDFTQTDHSQPFQTIDFRPIVSIRDFLRRPYKVFRNRYTNPELSAVKGLIEIDVADLLGIRLQPEVLGSSYTSFAASTLRVLQAMYLGFSGGARLKIVVQGASGASAWYVPPNFGTYGPAGSTDVVWLAQEPTPNAGVNAIAANRSMYQNLKYQANVQDREYSCQSVLQEKPNYFTSGLASLIDPDEPGLVSESACELEVEIPNMSPYRFTGDITGKSLPGSNLVRSSPTTNLGHLMVFIPQQVALAGQVETAGVYITIYAAVDDVARLGYQVFAPFILVPAVASPNSFGYEFLSTQNNPDGLPSSPSRPSQQIIFYTKSS